MKNLKILVLLFAFAFITPSIASSDIDCKKTAELQIINTDLEEENADYSLNCMKLNQEEMFKNLFKKKSKYTGETINSVVHIPLSFELENITKTFRAEGSISKSVVIGKIAHIEYTTNFTEYKKLVPTSTATAQYLFNYWNTADAVNKTLVDAVIKTFQSIPDLDGINISIPFKGNTNKLIIPKTHFNYFMGSKLHDYNTKDNHLLDIALSTNFRNDFIDRFKI